jgi:hypothetical protein
VTEPEDVRPAAPPGPARLPVLRPTPKRAQRQITLTIAAVLVVLIAIRLLSTHPLPKPSHASPQGATAGYVLGLAHANLRQVENYLAPDKRKGAPSMLRQLAHEHAQLTVPTLSQVSENGNRATATISLEVCYGSRPKKLYTCEPLGHAPLGLPSQIALVKLGGSWYADSLFQAN